MPNYESLNDVLDGIVRYASMAELADAQVSKTCGEIRVGSTPSGGTNFMAP